MMNLQIRNPTASTLITSGKVNIITCKKSIFGFHYPHEPRSNVDEICTKTNIMAFKEEQHAEVFMNNVDTFQRTKKIFPDRVFDSTISHHRLVGPMNVMRIEKVDVRDLTELCKIHWFDLCMIYDMKYEYNFFPDLGVINNDIHFEGSPSPTGSDSEDNENENANANAKKSNTYISSPYAAPRDLDDLYKFSQNIDTISDLIPFSNGVPEDYIAPIVYESYQITTEMPSKETSVFFMRSMYKK